jgi:RNA polymerase sigma-70 factor (ECF subfamily)
VVTARKPKLRVLPTALEGRPSGADLGFDDAQLLAAVKAGETRAASALYGRVRPQVDRTIRRLLGSRDPDHQDLAQQAMMELVFTIDRYRGECSLDSWTSTVTAHVVYKHLRHREVERRIFAESLGEVPVPTQQSPGRIGAARSLVTRIAAHLEDMDRDRAWAFVLHDVHGYDLKEIAAITKTTVAAAQTRLSRGRRELHERIAGDAELRDALDSSEGGQG